MSELTAYWAMCIFLLFNVISAVTNGVRDSLFVSVTHQTLLSLCSYACEKALTNWLLADLEWVQCSTVCFPEFHVIWVKTRKRMWLEMSHPWKVIETCWKIWKNCMATAEMQSNFARMEYCKTLPCSMCNLVFMTISCQLFFVKFCFYNIHYIFVLKIPSFWRVLKSILQFQLNRNTHSVIFTLFNYPAL